MLRDSEDCVWHPGRVEVLTGCMFSGKTQTLIGLITRLRGAGYRVAVFRPDADTRSPAGGLRSHSGLHLDATGVADAVAMRAQILDADQFIAIDEAQFFDERILAVCLQLAASGKHVLIAGLDLDFRGLPFGPMPRLLACAQAVRKLSARCSVCGEPAFLTQRLIDGRPATFWEKVVLPGGAELYEPRCYAHHEVPGRSLSLGQAVDHNLDWRLLDWASRLRAIGETGLNYSENTFDRERYGEVMSLALEIATFMEFDEPADAPISSTGQVGAAAGSSSVGYVTPKVAVAAAVFEPGGSILLVQRSDDLSWALPGGWADVGHTPSENAANEVYQETGLLIACNGLVGVYDMRLKPIGASLQPTYTLVFHAATQETRLALHREEIHAAQFFCPDKLPDLQPGAAAQIFDALRYHGTDGHAYFD